MQFYVEGLWVSLCNVMRQNLSRPQPINFCSPSQIFSRKASMVRSNFLKIFLNQLIKLNLQRICFKEVNTTKNIGSWVPFYRFILSVPLTLNSSIEIISSRLKRILEVVISLPVWKARFRWKNEFLTFSTAHVSCSEAQCLEYFWTIEALDDFCRYFDG